MLAADKAALEQDLRVSMTQIQWKELEYLRTNFMNLATSSAVLLGFGLSAIANSSTDRGKEDVSDQIVAGFWEGNFDDPRAIVMEITEGIFGIMAASALACNLIVLVRCTSRRPCSLHTLTSPRQCRQFVSTTVAMTGPGMALRGPEGSVIVAVRHMEEQNKRALRYFGRGLVAFNMSVRLATAGRSAWPQASSAQRLAAARARRFHLRQVRQRCVTTCNARGLHLRQVLMLGVRFCFGLGYLKGAAIISVSIYTFALLQHYGADIGEKFHLSSDTTVPRSSSYSR